MNKIITSLLALGLSLPLIACGEASPNESIAKREPSPKLLSELESNTTDIADITSNLISDYEDDEPTDLFGIDLPSSEIIPDEKIEDFVSEYESWYNDFAELEEAYSKDITNYDLMAKYSIALDEHAALAEAAFELQLQMTPEQLDNYYKMMEPILEKLCIE